MVGQNNTSPLPSSSQTSLLEKWAQDHRALLEVLLDAYCIVDLHNQAIDFNEAFTELCGESYRKIIKIGNFCDLLKTEHCPDQCPARQIAASGNAIRLDELSGSSKAFPELNMILAGVPIKDASGVVLGSLITIRNVSAEAELQKKYVDRAEASITDGLTRLFNKKHTEEYLLGSVKMSLRDRSIFTVGMIDIDHFKKVNDTFGHQAGDHVLSTVAQIIKNECRDTDLVGRFGGEEFMVILGATDARGAAIFAERLRKRIENTGFVFDGKRIPVTASFGSATFKETWQAGTPPEQSLKDIVSRADTALYFAKANGRNRVCQFETLPAPDSNAKAKEEAETSPAKMKKN